MHHNRKGGRGGTPWVWTQTTPPPPTNCWPEAPFGGVSRRGDGGGGLVPCLQGQMLVNHRLP